MTTTSFISTPKTAFPGQGDVLVLPLFSDDWQDDAHLTAYDRLVKRALTTKLSLMKFEGKKGQIVTLEACEHYGLVVAVGLGKRANYNPVAWRDALGGALRVITAYRLTRVTVYVNNLGSNAEAVALNTALAVHLTNYAYLKFKSEKDRKDYVSIGSVTLTSDAKWDDKAAEKGFKLGTLLADGICLTRDLVNEPAMTLGADELVKVAQEIAALSKGKITVKILDKAECEKLGMGSYLAVNAGSSRASKFVVLQRKSAKGKHVAFVGKSIIFDTGGLSLKPWDAMIEMKMDMAGGATVLGLFRILAQWDEKANGAIPVSVSGVLPICENMVSGTSMKPGDIVTAMNGKTIEILNTDAEGRLTLADGLVYAEKKLKADYIVDLATLTGACMVALGKEIAALFGNDDAFINRLKDSAKGEDEQIWNLPLYKPYMRYMKSDIADLQNIGGGRYGGAITAAMFLSAFVDKVPWVHLDIAGAAFNDEKARGIIAKGATGWGVLTLMRMIKTWK